MSGDRYPADGAAEIDLLTVWRVLSERRYLIAAFVAVGGIIAVIVALLMTPIFRAQVVLTEANEQAGSGIASIASQLGGLASLAGVNLPAGGLGPDALAMLKSQRLIDEFIRRNNLVDALQGKDPSRRTPWWAARTFKNDVLNIRQDTVERTVTVSIEWTDPATAARWANDFVALANELMRMRAMDEANRSVAYLRKQLEQTDVVEVRKAMFNLIEAETKTLMLTNARIEYAFKIIDPARPPELKDRPRRTLLVLLGCFLGFVVGAIAAFIHRSYARSRAAALAA